MVKHTITISDENEEKKIAKIISLSDGGFAFTVPYHISKTGYLFTSKIDYRKNEQDMKPIKDYTASDRVKLSMHIDGFVQFSGENQHKIISGRDEFGMAKGLGYLTSPLTHPIASGPTVALTTWGLHDYINMGDVKKGEDKICFGQSDIYYKDFPTECNGYLIECFVFPNSSLKGIRKDEKGFYADMWFTNFEFSRVIMRMRIMFMKSKIYFLGILVSKIKIFDSGPSGYVLCAPSELRKPEDSIARCMLASYPRLNFTDNGIASLDYHG